ncbi:MAG TPA: penicillin acylase family protein [Microvirga sp.]|nr:penicillin acylase family protein [Microvirga sp.]
MLLSIGAAAYFGLRGSLPRLEGTIEAPDLSAPVIVWRDDHGVPTLIGSTRADLAWALGYLHAQERFFQMDGLRRSAAGELSDLVGSAAVRADRRSRPHRFRHRAATVLAAMTAAERHVLNTYVAGVNRGLADLRVRPFEYLVLLSAPVPWTAEDTVLSVYAMYLSLQEGEGTTERRRAAANEILGRSWAEFLFPEGTTWDAALDDSSLPTPDLPQVGSNYGAVPLYRDGDIEPPVPGSNGFAVGGVISSRGAAIVANDMHLGLRVPNTWYRARLIVEDGSDTPALDITGVTLPGAPNIVAGSNGQVAWGFTNSYVDTSDLVVLEAVDELPNFYRTPHGPRELRDVQERLCQACAKPELLIVQESVWGPVIGTDHHGRKLAYRWIAHDPAAANLSAALELERAKSVREALQIAHRMGIPHQNLVAGDAEGNIGWTVTTPLPRRFGHDGRLPTSWADGSRGWDGYLPPHEVPIVLNPQGSRIWTANGRVIGGEALRKLGFGAYAHGARARQIRDGLLAKDRFTEEDLLAIQLDDRGLLLDRWQMLMLTALRARETDPKYRSLATEVEGWGGRAVPASVGYRLVRTFRTELIAAVYDAYTAGLPALEPPSPNQPTARRPASSQADEPVWRLMSERPAHLVPPGYRDWEAVIDTALSKVLIAVAAEAGGKLERFTWGLANPTGIRHPLSQSLRGLSFVLDPPSEPQPGDLYQPRVAAPGFGASERFVVAPGRESAGIFHMPTGQSGHPLSPYYTIGHDAWAKGRPTPFLPGEKKWQLTLRPN